MKMVKWFAPLLLSVVALQGCAPAAYKVKAPAPSEYKYTKTNTTKLEFSVTDARDKDNKEFSGGILKAGLLIDGKAIEPISYLKDNTAKELQARGVNAVATEAAPVNVSVNKLAIRNHRETGFSPFVTFTLLSADVTTPAGKQRVGVYIKRGKVPVWSFDEVIEPTFNEPLSLVVKEFAAKLNAITSKQSISDDQVSALAAQINTQPITGETYLKVYQLGFGFNKSAVKPLAALTKSTDEYVRLAAISSLGNLKAESELANLEALYNSATGLWQDRAMALKAICDIGTPDALAFAKKAQADLDNAAGKNKNDVAWAKELLSLYF